MEEEEEVKNSVKQLQAIGGSIFLSRHETMKHNRLWTSYLEGFYVVNMIQTTAFKTLKRLRAYGKEEVGICKSFYFLNCTTLKPKWKHLKVPKWDGLIDAKQRKKRC